MATTTQSELTTGTALDAPSYQEFWENISPDVLTKYEGKCVALRCGDQEWRIIDAADDFDRLHRSLSDTGVGLSKVVFDQVHRDDQTAAGIELEIEPNSHFRSVGGTTGP